MADEDIKNENTIYEDENKKNDENNNHNTKFNAINVLNLNKYTNCMFKFYSTIGINGVYFQSCDQLFFIIEILQLLIFFFNSKSLFSIPRNIAVLLDVFLLKFPYEFGSVIVNIIAWIFLIIFYGCFIVFAFGRATSFQKIPKRVVEVNVILSKIAFGPLFVPILFNFFNFLKQDDLGYKFNIDIHKNLFVIYSESIVGISLYFIHLIFTSNYLNELTPFSKRPKKMVNNIVQIALYFVVLFELLNANLINSYFKYTNISIVISIILSISLWIIHTKHQSFYSLKLNHLYGSLFFSFALLNVETLILTLLKVNEKSVSFFIYFASEIIFMVCGWFINMFLYKTMVKKITKKIQMKYDQHKIIEQLKEELEEENTQDINKSLESIVTIKKIVKKEKSFKNYVEASLLCKFIMYNRSTESFLLVQRIFKECVTEFPRNPNVYIEFWNHLHGMRIFISKNKMFFDDYNFLLKSINILADKVLYKVSNLDINLITKFRIYYSSFSYEESKEILNKRNYDKDDNDDNKNDTSVGFEVDMVKNIAVNYHIKCIISKKNIINELTNITNMETIESALNMNEEFSKVLLKAEKYYLIYINKFINSKEALYLYIMFLNNIMVMPALADEYLKRLEEKETEEKSDDDSYNERTKSYGYEKSEGVSSTSSSCTGNKRLKMLRHNMKYKFQKPIINMYRIMQIFITLMIIIGIVSNYENRKVFKKVISAVSGIHIGFQLPFIASRIKTDVRLSSLGLAANDRSIADYYLDDLKLNIDYLENTYLPFIYLRHSINVMDLFTVCPINNDVIDLTHNQNYFQNALRIHKKAKLYIDKFNQTENILNMDTLSDPIIRFFRVNSQNRFGPIFIKAIDLVVADNKKSINNQMRFVYIVIMILVLFEIFIIFGVITPSTNKCVSTLKEVFNVFKFIPKNYLDDLLNEYDSQLNEIYNKYNDDVMQLTTENDEKNNNNNNKKKVYSTKKLKLNFIIFSIISGILIILPFLTILLFKNQLINSISYLANSSKRTYYANSVGLLAFETLFQDESSFGKKISALLFENAEILQSYENKLKSGYYGATITDISVLNPYLSRPSCVRPKRLEFQCQNRTYDTVYTEELANSSLNYIMTEYIDKLNEFFGNMEGDYAISLIKPLDEVLHKILDHPFLSFYKKIIYDIAGHTLKYNEIGCEYLMKDVSFYLSLTLYTHCITSILLLILFSFYVTKKIKQQLHIMDVLTNVVFSVPLTLYDSSPRLKMFIETGKLK